MEGEYMSVQAHKKRKLNDELAVVVPKEGLVLDNLVQYGCTVDKHMKAKEKRHKKQRKKSSTDARNWFTDPNDRWEKGTWINCDLRYFDMSLLGNQFGVVYIDPPWNVAEKKITHSPAHTYKTLSDQEIKEIPVNCVSKTGFIFLWVPSEKLDFGLEFLSHWGYTYVDRIVWVKKTDDSHVSLESSQLFLQSSDMCLVGVKGSTDAPIEYIPKSSNDVFFATAGVRGRRPDQIYEIMEAMMPGALKIELFGCNHNIRSGWLVLGNQLGEFFEWDHDWITCDECSQLILQNQARYKSKLKPNLDLCSKCLEKRTENLNDFFHLKNELNEMVFHEYISCAECGCSPLWGLRFVCTICPTYNLCEGCYDKSLLFENEEVHKETHTFRCVEIPERAKGLAVHRRRCSGCCVFPICGICFTCEECENIHFCQQCFFHDSVHVPSHQFKSYPCEEDFTYQCTSCERICTTVAHLCNHCFNLCFCSWCYEHRETLDLTALKPSHNMFHTFTKASSEGK